MKLNVLEMCTPEGDIYREVDFGIPIAYLGNVIDNVRLQKQQRENPCNGKRYN